ncbi:hypothetical protein B0H17DRAFT_1214323 [Mycena rosella]|uniref:Uncharacterized protein n=1 Tax=Mycena rosella TaxID=1033263 RepID=A0AAD7CNI1_MYCRO|nr:hypothetical protein B0H17DRAFT_1214323 [Mycena rosella]
MRRPLQLAPCASSRMRGDPAAPGGRCACAAPRSCLAGAPYPCPHRSRADFAVSATTRPPKARAGDSHRAFEASSQDTRDPTRHLKRELADAIREGGGGERAGSATRCPQPSPKVAAFHLDGTASWRKPLAWHNNMYCAYCLPPSVAAREPPCEALPEMAFTKFENDLEEPELAEGVAQIKKVNWVFSGTEEERKAWSKWMLQFDEKKNK